MTTLTRIYITLLLCFLLIPVFDFSVLAQKETSLEHELRLQLARSQAEKVELLKQISNASDQLRKTVVNGVGQATAKGQQNAVNVAMANGINAQVSASELENRIGKLIGAIEQRNQDDARDNARDVADRRSQYLIAMISGAVAVVVMVGGGIGAFFTIFITNKQQHNWMIQNALRMEAIAVKTEENTNNTLTTLLREKGLSDKALATNEKEQAFERGKRL